MEEKLLENLGLSPVESKVYLNLLKIGSSLAGKISKESGINRTLVYDALARLIKKGFVSFITESNRKYFTATNPEIFFKQIREKEIELNNFKKQIPALISYYSSIKSEQEATIFKGKEGIKSIFEDILKEGKDYVLFGAEGKFKELFPYDHIHYQKRKKKLKIKAKAIFNEQVKGTEAVKELIGIVKYVPKQYSSPSTTFIYGDKIAVIIWSTIPLGISIKSKEVVESYKNYFNLMWKSSKN